MIINAETEKKLRQYAALLSEANKKARLTGPSDPSVIYDEHIADALPALPFVETAKNFIDVGTGGGIPGLVWGICLPQCNGLLIDSIGKKIRLVAEMSEALGCRNIETLNVRSEDCARRMRESFDIAAARAVANARVLAEYLSPLTAVGGRVIAFKGPGVHDEIDVPKHTWATLGLGEPELHRYELTAKERYLVVWQKIRPCPARFPRQPGMAGKKL